MPEDTGGSLKVASFNVLNYFTTLGSRGADTPDELIVSVPRSSLPFPKLTQMWLA